MVSVLKTEVVAFAGQVDVLAEGVEQFAAQCFLVDEDGHIAVVEQNDFAMKKIFRILLGACLLAGHVDSLFGRVADRIISSLTSLKSLGQETQHFCMRRSLFTTRLRKIHSHLPWGFNKFCATPRSLLLGRRGRRGMLRFQQNE